MFQYFPGNYMWSLSVLRALASGGHFGEIDWACSDLGEASKQEPKGDLEAWYAAWLKAATQVEAFADESREGGRNVSAREAYLRASVYFQWAEAFLDPDDARAPQAYEKHLATFASAAALMSPAVEIVEVPFEGSALTAYFVPANDPHGKPPVVLVSDGLDGTKEEEFPVALALAKRGITSLVFDGPGQGATLRLKGLPARFDSEVAVGVLCDYLATRGDVDTNRIGLLAASLGGYYAPRAVAFEKRVKACVAWSAIYDYYACWQRRTGYTPGEGIKAVGRGAALGTTGKHFLRIMGVADWDAAFNKLDAFRLKGVAADITCDILLVQGEHDPQTPLIEAEQLFAEIGSKHKELVVYREAEGGTAHVQLDRTEPALSRICDWLVDHLG